VEINLSSVHLHTPTLIRGALPWSAVTNVDLSSSLTSSADEIGTSSPHDMANALSSNGRLQQQLHTRFRGGMNQVSQNVVSGDPSRALSDLDRLSIGEWIAIGSSGLLVRSHYYEKFFSRRVDLMTASLRLHTDMIVKGDPLYDKIDRRRTVYTHILAWQQAAPGIILPNLILEIFRSTYGDNILAAANAHYRKIAQLEVEPEGRAYVRENILSRTDADRVAAILRG